MFRFGVGLTNFTKSVNSEYSIIYVKDLWGDNTTFRGVGLGGPIIVESEDVRVNLCCRKGPEKLPFFNKAFSNARKWGDNS